MTNNAYPFYLQLYQQVKILNYWSKWELQKYITRRVTGVKLLPVSCRRAVVRPLSTNIPWLNGSLSYAMGTNIPLLNGTCSILFMFNSLRVCFGFGSSKPVVDLNFC